MLLHRVEMREKKCVFFDFTPKIQFTNMTWQAWTDDVAAAGNEIEIPESAHTEKWKIQLFFEKKS